MRIQIVTNLDNGAGLEQDYQLLAGICREMGHTVNPVHIHRAGETASPADLNIFLEVLIPSLLPYSPRNWIVPNSEWWGAHWNTHLDKLDRVLCKTADCLRIWKGKMDAGKCVLIGWAARDLWDENKPKEIKFLHTAGKSQTKNTVAVTEAWRRYRIPYKLTVAAFKPEIARVCKGIRNVQLIGRFTEDQLREEVNSSRFFIMPSKYEGYGHAIHEALGCRAAVITTDGEPMRSFSGVPESLLVPVIDSHPMHEARAQLVSIHELAATVLRAATMPTEALDEIGDRARAGFLHDNARFHDAIRRQLCAL